MDKVEESSAIDLLMERRTVVLQNAITSDSVGEIAERMLELQERSHERITLIISSPGGDTFEALRLCDLMEHFITAPIRGIVIGQCNSAATFILLHCTERLATPHSHFVIHSSRVSGISVLVDRASEQILQDLLKQTKITASLVNKMYMTKLGMSNEQVEQLVSRGNQEFNDFLTVDEALEIGLIQSVVTGKLDIYAKPVSVEED